MGRPNRVNLQEFRLEKMVVWARTIAVEKERGEQIHRLLRFILFIYLDTLSLKTL